MDLKMLTIKKKQVLVDYIGTGEMVARFIVDQPFKNNAGKAFYCKASYW